MHRRIARGAFIIGILKLVHRIKLKVVHWIMLNVVYRIILKRVHGIMPNVVRGVRRRVGGRYHA